MEVGRIVPRRCVFCAAAGPLTNEHVIPDWISPLFPGATATVTTAKRDGTVNRYPLVVFDQRVNAVCEKCNSGWMSGLERSVAPFLGPMLTESKVTSLDKERQQLLATWTVKTVFMLELTQSSERIIPNSEYHRFHNVKQPPGEYFVWLGHRSALSDPDRAGNRLVWFIQEPISRIRVQGDETAIAAAQQSFVPGKVVFRVTLSIGHVVFQVFGHNSALYVDIDNTGTPFADSVDTVWPVRELWTWPPHKPIESVGGVQALHNAFNPSG